VTGRIGKCQETPKTAYWRYQEVVKQSTAQLLNICTTLGAQKAEQRRFFEPYFGP
jgi:hypothetical protein